MPSPGKTGSQARDMLSFKGQKYGFYPIFLLILQVGALNCNDYPQGIQNIVADIRVHRSLSVRRGTHLTGAAGADLYCPKGHQHHQGESGRRHHH